MCLKWRIRKRRVDGRPLTATERARYTAHFEPDVLDAARVIDGRVPFWLRPDMQGVTLGPRIYLRPGAYDPDSVGGVELLGHELVHVRQYRDGMTVWRYLWASRRGYRRNPYEVEAFALGARIRAEAAGRRLGGSAEAQLIASTERASASATSMPSTPADMMPPA